jgi:hypothetical protein
MSLKLGAPSSLSGGGRLRSFSLLSFMLCSYVEVSTAYAGFIEISEIFSLSTELSDSESTFFSSYPSYSNYLLSTIISSYQALISFSIDCICILNIVRFQNLILKTKTALLIDLQLLSELPKNYTPCSE